MTNDQRGSCGGPAPVDPDVAVSALAARQHGVVARRQLLRAGVAAHWIEYRLKRGRFRSLHRGVYRVGPVAGLREKEIAAVLACGETAVVSHHSAATAWQLASARPGSPHVDISIQRGCRSVGPGVRVRRVGPLEPDEITLLDGIPMTSPARTLVDLASCTDERDLERALARADRQRIADRESIERAIDRRPRRRGAHRLRALLSRGGPAMFTRSDAEARFLAMIRKARLRMPEANVVVLGHEVDFLWRAERLVVEIDGFAFHSSRSAFEGDRQRDAVLTAAGLRVIRVTWRQLSGEPEPVLARVAQALVQTSGA